MKYSTDLFTFDSINNYYGYTESLICNNKTEIIINEIMNNSINNNYWIEFILLSDNVTNINITLHGFLIGTITNINLYQGQYLNTINIPNIYFDSQYSINDWTLSITISSELVPSNIVTYSSSTFPTIEIGYSYELKCPYYNNTNGNNFRCGSR